MAVDNFGGDIDVDQQYVLGGLGFLYRDTCGFGSAGGVRCKACLDAVTHGRQFNTTRSYNVMEDFTFGLGCNFIKDDVVNIHMAGLLVTYETVF